jgi:hypothetical protein
VAATVGGLAEAVGLSDFAVAGRHALTGGDSGRELEKDELVGDDDHCDQLLALGNRTGSRSLRWRSRFVADEALHGIAEIVPPGATINYGDNGARIHAKACRGFVDRALFS